MRCSRNLGDFGVLARWHPARRDAAREARRAPHRRRRDPAHRADDAWSAAELERITLHEARHTYASLMIAAGVNAKALSTYMGHANISITLDRYGHLMPGNEAEAATAARRLPRGVDSVRPPWMLVFAVLGRGVRCRCESSIGCSGTSASRPMGIGRLATLPGWLCPDRLTHCGAFPDQRRSRSPTCVRPEPLRRRPMDINMRIANLVAATATGVAIEQELLHSRVLAIAPALTQTPGATAPLLVVLESRRSAFFKRYRDQSARACAHYGHERLGVPLNEVIAWRLACALGAPWSQLVPASVLRVIDNAGGALTNDRKGKADLAVLDDASAQVKAAGFWDALVGNQDRHMNNFRYIAARRSLGLIDHGYSFARPGDILNASFFSAHRRSKNEHSLLLNERAALTELVDSGDLHGLRGYLPTDRADALEGRAHRMLQSGCLPLPGAF
jgi:hypothetical protein